MPGRINPLSPEAEARYFQAALRYPKLHDLGRLMILQGCRPEELLALQQVAHIDLERRECAALSMGRVLPRSER